MITNQFSMTLNGVNWAFLKENENPPKLSNWRLIAYSDRLAVTSTWLEDRTTAVKDRFTHLKVKSDGIYNGGGAVLLFPYLSRIYADAKEHGYVAPIMSTPMPTHMGLFFLEVIWDSNK